MKTKWSVYLFVICLSLLSCKDENRIVKDEKNASPAVIYFNGDIITMEGTAENYIESIVEQNGEIVFLGPYKEAKNTFLKATEFDLEGKTLLPGFIEPHLHPSLAAIMLQNDIVAPYDWKLPTETKKGVQGQEAYRNRIEASIKSNATLDKMYFIWGFHPLWHGELSRDFLNKISGNQPVGIIHRSFHEIYINDAAIDLLGIKEADFKGNPQVEWSKGHFYEGGWLALVPKMAPILLEPKGYLKGLNTMSKLLLQNGITTIAEPGFPSSNFDGELSLLKKEMAKNPPYDVYLIPNGTQLYTMKKGNSAAMEFMETLSSNEDYNTENIHFLPKQVKLFSDGAIYSQLMQMKKEYTDGHTGEWMTPLGLFEEQLMMYWDNDYKIHVHSNGDLGQQMVIDLVEKAQANNTRENHRLTLHHMGYFEEEMAEQMSDLGIEASVNPYYLWALADKYSEFGLGKERAENLVALKLLTDRNIPLSFHSDFSMAPVEPLTLAWTAINRETSQGSKFSQDQKITVFNAIKAITIDAARTLNLENEIGSLKTGKTANFTLLDENPYKIDPMSIKDITIDGLVYKGKYVANTSKRDQLVGGWSDTEINHTVVEVVDFVLNQVHFSSGLKRIINAKEQIVNGTNFHIAFELENNEVWQAKVHKSFSNEFVFIEKPEQQKF